MLNHFLTITKVKYLSAALLKDSNKMSCLQEIVPVPVGNTALYKPTLLLCLCIF